MHDPEGEGQPATQTVEAEEGCPVKMSRGHPCARPIYAAPPGVDNAPVCLMHSRDPQKDSLEFWMEFQRILLKPLDGVADFSRFVFPRLNFLIHSFEAECIFIGAIFAQDVDFSSASFLRRVHFDNARFVGNADFGEAEFKGEARFFDATFEGNVRFTEATFYGMARFCDATFMQTALFHLARFEQSADFNMATFQEVADFGGADFLQGGEFTYGVFAGQTDFAHAKFQLGAGFWGATFEQKADFTVVIFSDCADFNMARFMNDADFSEATFTQDPDFDETTFAGTADFQKATFKGRVEFRETKFREDATAQPGPVFSLARFEKQEFVVFYNTYLGQALFHNCDVSRFVFSSVRWRQRSNGKRMVLEDDEELDLTQAVAGALCPDQGSADERDYGLIAELYQQLKKNYDDRKDYWTAGDFHYGEMEMKRLSSRRRNPVLRWLHRNLGLVAWYKYASDYGESYVEPFLRLLLVLALFTFIYPVCGLHRSSSEKGSPSRPVAQSSSFITTADEISYGSLSQFLSTSQNGRLRGTVGFFVQSAMTAVSVATLRRDFADYEPLSVPGRVAALIEFLLTSTLVALFLLAVRRQFRR